MVIIILLIYSNLNKKNKKKTDYESIGTKPPFKNNWAAQQIFETADKSALETTETTPAPTTESPYIFINGEKFEIYVDEDGNVYMKNGLIELAKAIDPDSEYVKGKKNWFKPSTTDSIRLYNYASGETETKSYLNEKTGKEISVQEFLSMIGLNDAKYFNYYGGDNAHAELNVENKYYHKMGINDDIVFDLAKDINESPEDYSGVIALFERIYSYRRNYEESLQVLAAIYQTDENKVKKMLKELGWTNFDAHDIAVTNQMRLTGTSWGEVSAAYDQKLAEQRAALMAFLALQVAAGEVNSTWNSEGPANYSDPDFKEFNFDKGAGKSVKVIDGKVGGKVPVEEYNAIKGSSVKNPKSDTLTLGKYADDATSYTKRAGDTSHFDMGDNFNATRQKYNLSGDEMFEYFNKPVLDEAISSGKTIRFSHNPVSAKGFLGSEWNYIKSTLGITDANLVYEGGFWVVRLK